MMNIQTPAARANDPISSHLAADEINQSGSRHAQGQRVIAAMIEAYKSGRITRSRGITTKELSVYYGLDRHMVARRMSDLETARQAFRSGPDETRRCGISERQSQEWWPSTRLMDQAENRMHAQNAIMVKLMKESNS